MDDCVIIGAGVIGLSLAYELAGQGMGVRVLDRQAAGRETSWTGAGILPAAPKSANASDAASQIAALSMSLHPELSAQLLAETGIDNQFRRCGAIYLAVDAGSLSELRAQESVWQREGIAHERLTPARLMDIEPSVSEAQSGGSIVAATYVPDEAQLRNPRHLQALAAACRMRGVTIEESIEVHDFAIDRGRATAVETTAGIRGGGSFCITTGAWTSALAAKLGLELAVIPIRGQMVLFSGPRPTLAHIVNVGRRYLVPRKDGRVLVGSTEEDAGFDRATTESGIRGLLEFAWSLIPEWRGATVEQTWAGLRPGTPDGLPYLDRLPDCENVFIAAGHYRGGIYLSPGTARVMSELIRGERPSIDLSSFRLQR